MKTRRVVRSSARSTRSAPVEKVAEPGHAYGHPEIPLRELRNSISRVLAEVARGQSYRITVAGRAVADLVPASQRRVWVPWAEVQRILREAPLDENFLRDVGFMRDQYADEQ